MKNSSDSWDIDFLKTSPMPSESSSDQIEIMLQRLDGYQKPDFYTRREGGVWDAYIRVKGVKDFYESIRNDVEILLPLKKQFYGDWEFEEKDLNGYVLVFSELID